MCIINRAARATRVFYFLLCGNIAGGSLAPLDRGLTFYARRNQISSEITISRLFSGETGGVCQILAQPVQLPLASELLSASSIG